MLAQLGSLVDGWPQQTLSKREADRAVRYDAAERTPVAVTTLACIKGQSCPILGIINSQKA